MKQIVLILGVPELDVEAAYPDAEIQYGVIEDIPDTLYAENAEDMARAIGRFVSRNVIYVAEAQSGMVRAALSGLVSPRIIDEAMLLLERQLAGDPIETPEGFEEALIEASYSALEGANIEAEYDGDKTVVFNVAGKKSGAQTAVFDGDTVLLNGAILRNVAVVGNGHCSEELLGNRVLTPGEVMRFIANRVAINGPTELCGYGRAFGPSADDKTNATLAQRSRTFRACGMTGVVVASMQMVSRAKADLVVSVGKLLRQTLTAGAAETIRGLVDAKFTGRDNDLLTAETPEADEVLNTLVFMHQQAKELYVGKAAASAFRMRVWLDEDCKIIVEAYGKSSKHWRVDAGAYCLHTEAGGYVDLDVVLGQFEESNDGSVYAPLAYMQRELRGFLRETVEVKRDFAYMSEEARLKYMTAEITVAVGDRIEPGDTVMRCDDRSVRWESKADYGVVTGIVEEPGSELDKFARYAVQIQAWFEGDAKIRGFGKGLVCPMEAAGVRMAVKVGGVADTTERMLIGVPGIVKDSAAANEYVLSQEPCEAKVTTEHNPVSFEAMVRKHAPDETLERYADVEDPPVVLKRYPNGVVVTFDYRKKTITTYDPNAIAARIRVVIEAAPVGQSVGSSSVTMPQIGFLASFPDGNSWLNRFVLPKVRKRVDALAYWHAVAGQVDPSKLNLAEEETPAGDDELDIVIAL